MEHHCHARNCQIEVKPEMLMCFKHWRMVSRNIQKAIWDSYRPGQCDDKNPSAEWHEAADAAIGYVARKEGNKVRESEVNALIKFGK